MGAAVPTAGCLFRLGKRNGPQCRVTANILKRHLLTAGKGWSSMLVLGEVKTLCFEPFSNTLDLDLSFGTT